MAARLMIEIMFNGFFIYPIYLCYFLPVLPKPPVPRRVSSSSSDSTGAMSETGIIHFADVKNIFISLYIIVLLFIFVLGIYLVMKHHDKDKCILSIFNKGANLVFIVFSILIGLITFNFSNTFTMFHKIFFRNDYWLFDYRTDPVILALPEELFMILSVIIIIILFIVCLAIKVTYYKVKNLNSKKLRQT